MMRLVAGGVTAFLAVLFGWCGPALGQRGSHSTNKFFVSGYGELHYNNPSDGIAELDLHRLVLGFGYQFTDNIRVSAELDFEHAFTEPEVEFAHLDFFYRDPLSFRAGLMLMPVGPLNESHEPPLFYSVERPHVQKFVIPTTWQEPGAGALGTLADGKLGYRAYIVGGLDASMFTGADGIRKGRQKAAEAKAEDLAVVGRLEYSPFLNLTVGASGYVGRAAQGNRALADAAVGIVEADAVVKKFGFELVGVASVVHINAADSISAVAGEVVGERIIGWYGEVAYRLLSQLHRGSTQDLVLFARYEEFDTHDQVPEGLSRNPEYDRRVATIGASFLPIPQIAVKADSEFWETAAGSTWEQVNVGIAYMY